MNNSESFAILKSIDRPIHTGLSGNEIYCLSKKGLNPGNLVIGNSVYSMGVLGGLYRAGGTLLGGEVDVVTRLIADGREQAFERLVAEGKRFKGVGVTGITSELIQHPTGIEFLSVGSCVHPSSEGELKWRGKSFSSSADGQELYCQLDCGFEPHKFAFGNVAYSLGLGQGLLGAFKSMGRGEVDEFTDVFTQTRHLALSRIKADAMASGSNAVVGIETAIVPFMGLQEMSMMGTASYHPLLGDARKKDPVTSDLTNEEMWNLVNMGYMPEKLLLGVSVYSLGIVGGFMAGLRGFVRGEQTELTQMIYEARESAIQKIRKEAEACGADDIVGIKTYIYNLGAGLIEFMAIGTAVKKIPGTVTESPSLIAQAVIRDRDTFTNAVEPFVKTDLNTNTRSQPAITKNFNPLQVVFAVIGILIYLFILKSKLR